MIAPRWNAWKGPTIEQQMILHKHASGFDYMRLFLSVCIILCHTIILCYPRTVETAMWTGPSRPFFYFLVPSFFAMSGFLVAGSLVRVNNIPAFLTLRAMRILPALCGEVIISAVIIGGILTDLPLSRYFTHKNFYAYFLNIVGDVHFWLPGVLTQHRISKVNAQLWTIPYEFECYALITILAFIGIVRHRAWLAVAAVILTLLMNYADYRNGDLIYDWRPTGLFTVSGFLWGIILYMYRDKIPCNALLFLLATALSWWALTYEETMYVAGLPVAYMTIYLGLMNPKRTLIITSGDYSYGLYLYGFPVQQALSQLVPASMVWYIHLPLTILIAGFCAVVSWHLLEARVLSKKKQMLALVESLRSRMQRRLILFA